ncbi:MAG: hypothetical protein KIT87_16235 [Anaerolineae bacterium]|nr:hypothetical protein [Anaerolineae bacterium]
MPPIDIILTENSRRDGIALDAVEADLLRRSGLVEIAPAWEPGHYSLTARPVVGRVALPRRSVVLQPKAPLANLFTMLGRLAGQSHLHVSDDALAGYAEGDAAPLGLVDLYLQALDAYLAAGLRRRPTPVTEATPFVRGKLLLTPTLRQPPARRHRPVTQRTEWSADTLVNQLLKQAARVALQTIFTTHRPPSALARRLDLALDHLHVVADTTHPESAFDHVHLTRLETDAAPALVLARWLVAGCAPALDPGDRPFPVFWLDVARLFEAFVARLLRDELDAQVTVQRALPLDQAEQVSLRPDVVVQRRGGLPLVLDTKYKLPGLPQPGDLYQLLTYCQALGAAHGGLIYPAPTSTPPLIVRQSGLTVHALALDLGVVPADFAATCAAFLGHVSALL